MNSFEVTGGKRLKGEIIPQGAKNEALQVISAVLLSNSKITISNIPDILDVNLLIEVLQEMGVKINRPSRHECSFQADDVNVDYLNSDPRRFHVTYQLTSMTYRRRVRLEVAVAEGVGVPIVTSVYPTADWHERETYDMYGVIFTGHPNLTRILMPDDWEGFPQRKDYPLGGVPVEYKGAEIPPPDQRRVYQ